MVVAHVHDVATLLALRRVSSQLRSELLPGAVLELNLSSLFVPRTHSVGDASWFDNAAMRRKARNDSEPRRCLLAAVFQLMTFFPHCTALSVRDCVVSTEQLNRVLAGVAFARLLSAGTLSASDLSHQHLHVLAKRECMEKLGPLSQPLARVALHSVVFVGSGCLCCRSTEERFCLRLWKALGELIKNATAWFEL